MSRLSNARHHPPPAATTQPTSQGAGLMRGTLRAVGCMPLLGGTPLTLRQNTDWTILST
jgi:hypothetical protein